MYPTAFLSATAPPLEFTFFTDKALTLAYCQFLSLLTVMYDVVLVATKVIVFVTFVEPVTFPDVSITPDSSLFGTLLLIISNFGSGVENILHYMLHIYTNYRSGYSTPDP